jgi:hypothetical protein
VDFANRKREPAASGVANQQVDLSPVLRQMVKTHFSLNGELSHGIVS